MTSSNATSSNTIRNRRLGPPASAAVLLAAALGIVLALALLPWAYFLSAFQTPALAAAAPGQQGGGSADGPDGPDGPDGAAAGRPENRRDDHRAGEPQPRRAGQRGHPDRSNRRRGEGGGGLGGPFSPRWLGRLAKGLRPPPTDQEWNETEAFFREHSPKRSEAFSRLPDDNKGRRRNIKQLVHSHYAELKRLEKEDPEVYQLRLKQVRAEDDIFGMLMDRWNAGPSRADWTALSTPLREQVALLVDLDLQERRLRLDRRQQSLDKQKQALADDESRRDERIERRLSEIRKAAERHRPRGGNRPGGGGGARDGSPTPVNNPGAGGAPSRDD
jgi:hypothetical protein